MDGDHINVLHEEGTCVATRMSDQGKNRVGRDEEIGRMGNGEENTVLQKHAMLG